MPKWCADNCRYWVKNLFLKGYCVVARVYSGKFFQPCVSPEDERLASWADYLNSLDDFSELKKAFELFLEDPLTDPPGSKTQE